MEHVSSNMLKKKLSQNWLRIEAKKSLAIKSTWLSKRVEKSISFLLFENTKAFLDFLRKDGII